MVPPLCFDLYNCMASLLLRNSPHSINLMLANIRLDVLEDKPYILRTNYSCLFNTTTWNANRKTVLKQTGCNSWIIKYKLEAIVMLSGWPLQFPTWKNSKSSVAQGSSLVEHKNSVFLSAAISITKRHGSANKKIGIIHIFNSKIIKIHQVLYICITRL